MDRSRGGTHRTPWTAVAAELTEWWLNEQQNVSSNYAQKTRMLHNAMLARLSHDIYNVVCDASAHLMQETPTILYMLQQSWRNEWMNEWMHEWTHANFRLEISAWNIDRIFHQIMDLRECLSYFRS